MALSKKITAGWVAAMVIVSVWMFIIGVLAGRGTISVEPLLIGEEGEIAQEIQKGVSSGKIEPRYSQTLPDNPELGFYSELKNSDEPAFEKTKSVKKRERDVLTPATGAVSAKTAKPAEVAVQVKQDEPQVDSKTPPSKKQSEEAAPSAGKYSIQVAALKTTDVAAKAVEDLKKKGYDSYFVKGIGADGRIWYRVRIGSYGSRQEAKADLSRLSAEKIDAFLVARQEK